ncbi:MAG: SpoIIE family protein phosphatase [Anaerolineales bacterium]|nr:SpoIIE family protein phosphatase [Chloroflexota bacterium]MBL6979895.1 SpoIIE family protein phosphatase [Anaerolineales bacterium]
MEVQIAVSKVKKYATSTSGDTVEVVERPNGGVSVVMADGQSSGRGAKWVSSFVVRKVISLLADGVRDGAAARAASDALFTERGGKVSATLNMLSADFLTNTLVMTRNNPAPVLLARDEEIKLLDEESTSIGIYRNTRPVITEAELVAGLTVVVFTDGITHAGSRYGESMDFVTCLQSTLDNESPTPQFVADALLKHALKLDQGRPVDDISVVALRVVSTEDVDQFASENLIRRMTVSLPIGR